MQEYIHTGAASGWTGNGIISSTAAGQNAVAVGFAEASTLGLTKFGGITVDTTAVLIRYTWVGDANLDGVVNPTDLAMMSSNGSTWAQGDFNYDGQVNADDYALFELGAAKGGNTVIPLPEPAFLAYFIFPLLLPLRN